MFVVSVKLLISVFHSYVHNIFLCRTFFVQDDWLKLSIVDVDKVEYLNSHPKFYMKNISRTVINL